MEVIPKYRSDYKDVSSVVAQDISSQPRSIPQPRNDYNIHQIDPLGGRYPKPDVTEVIIMDTNLKLVEEITKKSMSIAEKDLLIQELTAKLAEFERIHQFESDGLDLPDDYYENDAYLSD